MALIGLWAPPMWSAADIIYWANYGNNTPSCSSTSDPGTISFASLNEPGGGQLDTTGATLRNPNGVAIDATANRLYWPNRCNDTISFANLDGSGGGGQLNTGGATLSEPRGVVIDPAAHRIYWANFGNDTISFANLDGSGGGQLNTAGARLSNPQGVAINPAGTRIYWTNQGNDTISFARLDGSGGGGQLNTRGASLDRPTGLAIDAAANRIYWANQSNPPAFDKMTISFANLDGSGGGGQLDTTGAILRNPAGVAIDPVADRIYWANVLNDTISFANLDGSGGGQLDTTGAILDHPNFPALLVTLDTTAPQTKIVKAPKHRTERRRVRFEFRSSEPGSGFECKLDRRRFKPCTSPHRSRRLSLGRHRFKVRAIDPAGNVDPTAAKRTFWIVRRDGWTIAGVLAGSEGLATGALVSPRG